MTKGAKVIIKRNQYFVIDIFRVVAITTDILNSTIIILFIIQNSLSCFSFILYLISFFFVSLERVGDGLGLGVRVRVRVRVGDGWRG